MKLNQKHQQQPGPVGVYRGLGLGIREVQGGTEQYDTGHLLLQAEQHEQSKGKV